MNIIKNTALSLLLALSFGATSTSVSAEEAANGSESIKQTIAHVEKGLIEVNKSDFSAAQLHLKSDRLSSEKIEGNEAVIKEANADVVQGQIQAKLGEVKKSADFLNKALTLYKSL